MRGARSILLAAVSPVLLAAHTGAAIQPHDIWTAWSFEPGIFVPLLVSGLLYGTGARPSRGASPRQIVCFAAGWALLAIALVSPLHPLGSALFSAHMAQHEILMLGAAPMLVLARPLVPMLHGMPLQWRRMLGRSAKTRLAQGLWRRITEPFTAWWIHAAALWLWHIPRLFEATLVSEWIHAAQHASFFVSALLFWWSLFYRPGYGGSVLYVFTTAVHTSILGALLTLSPRIWYAGYAGTTSAWGLTPLEDQQLGGLIMWVPAGVIYLAVGLTLLAAWLHESENPLAKRRYA
jgi:putative membrane protein